MPDPCRESLDARQERWLQLAPRFISGFQDLGVLLMFLFSLQLFPEKETDYSECPFQSVPSSSCTGVGYLVAACIRQLLFTHSLILFVELEGTF